MSGAGGIVRATWVGTAVFAASALAAAFVEETRGVAIAIDLVLFAIGVVAFLWAFAIAVGRSRTETIGIGGLYFLAGDTAPAATRRSMLGAFVVQVVVAFASASSDPYTSLAFGILVPVFGLGLAGLWGARFGEFSSRDQKAG